MTYFAFGLLLYCAAFPSSNEHTAGLCGSDRVLDYIIRDHAPDVQSTQVCRGPRARRRDPAQVPGRVGSRYARDDDGRIAASIAHEINQPLAAIVNNGSACQRWLAGDAPNLEEAREAARDIVRDGNRAGAVITRIRALVRKTETEKARLEINQTVQEVVLLTQNEAVRKGVALRMELAADLPPVLGDRVQLQQVILNLVMNGVEAMASVTDRPRELLICSRTHESDQVLWNEGNLRWDTAMITAQR